MSDKCLCCQKGLNTEGKRVCPLCNHVFRGHGWDGIDAHWRAKHEKATGIPYEEFWASLCAGHKGRQK